MEILIILVLVPLAIMTLPFWLGILSALTVGVVTVLVLIVNLPRMLWDVITGK